MIGLAFLIACVAVLWRVWRFDALRPVALALFVGFWEANLAQEFWPFETRLVLDPMAEIGVGIMAANAWVSLRGRGGGRATPIIILSALSVACAFACSLVGTLTDFHRQAYVYLTNFFFGVQLVLVGVWGTEYARAGAARWGRRATDIGPAPGARHGG